MARAPMTGNGAPLARRWLLNLALLVVVVALAVAVWLRSDDATEPEALPLTSLAPEDVRTVEIVRVGEPDVRLERRDGAWRLSAPIAARVDSFALESVLDLARAPADRPVKTEGADLARFGLAPPELTVRLNDVELQFGAAHPIEDRRYLRHESGVYLVPVRFYRAASSPYTNFIDTRLIEPGSKMVALELPDFELALDGGTWRRVPEIETLSSDRINAFVDDWRHARALTVREYGGDAVQQRVSLTLETPDGGTAALDLGILAREPELVLYRKDEGLQYHFPQALAERLLVLSPEKEPVQSEE